MKSSIRSEGHVKGALSRIGHHGRGQRHQQSYIDSHRQKYQALLLAGEYRTFQTVRLCKESLLSVGTYWEVMSIISMMMLPGLIVSK